MSNNMQLSSLLTPELSVPTSNQRSLSVLSSREASSIEESGIIPSISSQAESAILSDSKERGEDPLQWPARKERKSWVWLPENGKDVWHEKINGWKWHCARCMWIITSSQEICLLIRCRSRAKEYFVYRWIHQEYDKPSCSVPWF